MTPQDEHEIEERIAVFKSLPREALATVANADLALMIGLVAEGIFNLRRRVMELESRLAQETP